MSSPWRWRLILLGLFAGGFLAVYVPGTLLVRSLTIGARGEEDRLEHLLLRSVISARSRTVEIAARDLASHPVMEAAPCSRSPGDEEWLGWIDKVSARTGADEIRVVGQERRLVASLRAPEAFGMQTATGEATEFDGLAFGPPETLPGSTPTLFWITSLPLPNCPWLETELLWSWAPSQGIVEPADSLSQGTLAIHAATGGILAGITLPTTRDDASDTGWTVRMLVPSLAGGIIVLLAGWLLLLPQRRAWQRVEKEAQGAWRLMQNLSGDASGEPPPVGDLLRWMSEEALDLASRAERLAHAAGWRDVGRAIGHEVRNALTPLRLTVGTLAIQSKDDPRMQEGLQAAQSSLERVQRLVEEFSNFARLPGAKLRSDEVGDLVGRCVEAWTGAGPPAVEVRRTEPLRARVDPDLLDRVLQNLVKNAREAAGSGGRVEVSCSEEGGDARVTVWNSGPPIPEGLLESIFEGGLSTKPTGHGLGLAIARELTTRMGGRIWAENASGGVAFHLAFARVGHEK